MPNFLLLQIMGKSKDVGKDKESSKETPRTTPVVTRSKQKGEKLKAANQRQDPAEITSPLDAKAIAAASLKAVASKADAAKATTTARAHEQREGFAESTMQ